MTRISTLSPITPQSLQIKASASSDTILNQLQILTNSIDALSNDISHLVDNLSPILKPFSPEPDCTVGQTITSDNSDIYHKIYDEILVIQSLNTKVQKILNHLDI